ncbi:MAG: response regulator transcription factor [Eubacteriales bacterium]|jgi:two-component system response regulator VicR
MRILVVDDEQLLVKGIKFNLENEGYEVDAAYDGATALEMIQNNHYDLVVLDLMLPQLSGLEVCSRVREFSNIPIIMVTAKSEDADKVMGFEHGADDYLTKPFNIVELKVRIRAILRRSGSANNAARQQQSAKADTYEKCGIALDYNSRNAIIDGREIELTSKEFDLLDLLMKNPGKVYSRDNMLNLVWGYEYPGDVRTVDVHIRRLREKIEKHPAEPELVMTKWGVGYYFKDK